MHASRRGVSLIWQFLPSWQVTLLGYSLDTFPQGFAKGDLQNALDGLQWGAS